MSLDYLTGRKLDEIINQNNLIIEQNQLILSILSKEVKGTKVKKEKTNEYEIITANKKKNPIRGKPKDEIEEEETDEDIEEALKED